MIKELINDKLREKAWTFSEITNVTHTIDELAQYAYDKMTAKEKLDLIWLEEIHEPLPDYEFGSFFSITVMNKLKAEIAIIIKEELSVATVTFKEDNKNEISKRSVGGKPHKERPTDEKGHSEESS